MAKAYTLSDRIGKVVALYADLQGRLPAHAAPIYIVHDQLRRYCREGGG